MNILGKRYYFFAFSLLVIIPGLIVMALWGLPFSIDFTGGSMLEIKFASGQIPDFAKIESAYQQVGITDIQIQTTGVNSVFIRSDVIDETRRQDVITLIEAETNDTVEILQYDTVGPNIGKEVTNRAGFAVAIASLAVIIYITFAFRGIKNSLRFGACAIIAMIHDFLVILSVSAIGGKFFGWQFDTLFLSAFLTVIGFSVQDTIVVFDRYRENSTIFRKVSFEKLANHSIVQSLGRSINTQLMTSEFLLLSMALFGGSTLKEFSIILLVGLFMGTYSSIFVAFPLLVVWENKEWKTWFKKKNADQSA